MRKYRVGIYLRLSDEDRDKFNKSDDSESIKNQRNLLIEEINKRDDFILVDEYCDEDLSGAGTYRPEFERLIKDCENGKIDVVLCKSQSRFSRDMEIIERYIHNKFILWNVRFIGISDNADTFNMGNKKSRQINGLVNEWYLEDVSNNIRSAFKAKMNQGEFISPFACFGYEIDKFDNNKLVVDKEASLLVIKIFDLYLSGLGYMGIAKYLNDRNIPSPSLYKYRKGCKLNVVSNKKREDIKWNSNAIKSILTNEIYLGNLVQGKRTTVSYKNHKVKNKDKSEWIRCENTHFGIIDREVFDRVQGLIKDRNRGRKDKGNIHLFSGKINCQVCGMRMRRKVSGKNIYLVCSSEMSGDRCSNKKSIRYDVLESIVLGKINELIGKFYDSDVLRKADELWSDRNSIDDKVRLLEKKRKMLNDKINEMDRYLKCLYEDRVNGIISVNRFKFLMDENDKVIDECKKNILIINNEIDGYKDKNFDRFRVYEYKKFDKLNRFMIDEFINKIYIGSINKDNDFRNIEIEWNF